MQRAIGPFTYACVGVSRASNTTALFQRAKALGVLAIEDKDLTDATLPAVMSQLAGFITQCDVIYMTICLDVLPAADAPGVSAPAARGVSLPLIETLVEQVRDCGKLRLCDIAELNPDYDIDSRTARVAARLVHTLSLAPVAGTAVTFQ